MNATNFWWGVGDFMDSILSLIYDEKNMITTVFNTSVVIFGFLAILYWLSRQKKFNKQAAENKDQLK
jgi:hypothetical protein